jgi:mRNA-degrading endonuclease RelE of RelBE toxin-antitoxin system
MHVEWSTRALDDATRLDTQTRKRIYDSIERFAETGYGDIKKLQGPYGHRRLRVGQYRVRFMYDDSSGERVFVVLRVLPRDRAYRDHD